MANSLWLSAITLHNVLEWKVCVCNLKNHQKEFMSERVDWSTCKYCYCSNINLKINIQTNAFNYCLIRLILLSKFEVTGVHIKHKGYCWSSKTVHYIRDTRLAFEFLLFNGIIFTVQNKPCKKIHVPCPWRKLNTSIFDQYVCLSSALSCSSMYAQNMSTSYR